MGFVAVRSFCLVVVGHRPIVIGGQGRVLLVNRSNLARIVGCLRFCRSGFSNGETGISISCYSVGIVDRCRIPYSFGGIEEKEA